MLQVLGAHAVGFSTVLEVIAARHHGARVLAMSAITNVNNPEDMQPISLEQIIDGAALITRHMQIILNGVLAELAL